MDSLELEFIPKRVFNSTKPLSVPLLRAEQPTDLDHAIKAYSDLVVEEEKADFTSDLVPLASHIEKVRETIEKSFEQFKNSFEHGYHQLLQEISKDRKANPAPDNDMQEQEQDQDQFQQEQALEATIDPEKAALLEDSDKLLDLLAQGKALYEILGYTSGHILKFYKIGCRLLNDKYYEEAKNIFFFLATIAPTMSEAWLGLAWLSAQANQLEEAISACQQALELDPTNPDIYLTYARIYILNTDFDNASEICDQAINYATDHTGEEWAELLASSLGRAKLEIDLQYRNIHS